VKTTHNIFALLFIGVVCYFSVSMQQPLINPALGSTATPFSKVQEQRQLTTPLFFESQRAETNVTIQNFVSGLDGGKFTTATALVLTPNVHTTAVSANLSRSNQLVLKTRKVDLLYPSHFFW